MGAVFPRSGPRSGGDCRKPKPGQRPVRHAGKPVQASLPLRGANSPDSFHASGARRLPNFAVHAKNTLQVESGFVRHVLPVGRNLHTFLKMRAVSCLIALVLAVFSAAGNQAFCSTTVAPSVDCCSTKCPAGSSQAGPNCCHMSEGRATIQSAVPTQSPAPALDLVSGLSSVLAPASFVFEKCSPSIKPRSGLDLLSLLCSRQI